MINNSISKRREKETGEMRANPCSSQMFYSSCNFNYFAAPKELRLLKVYIAGSSNYFGIWHNLTTFQGLLWDYKLFYSYP